MIDIADNLYKLNEHKARQIDENRKISRRVDDLERAAADRFSSYNTRIEKLESHYYSDGDLYSIHGQIDNINKNDLTTDHQIKFLEKRIEDLEVLVTDQRLHIRVIFDKINERIPDFEKDEELRELVKKIISSMRQEKTPYACPVCKPGQLNGAIAEIALRMNFIHDDLKDKLICPACEGKGIVWG